MKVYPYGLLDFVDKERGVTLRFLNPRNLILYVEIEKIIGWYIAKDPTASKSQSVSELKAQVTSGIA